MINIIKRTIHTSNYYCTDICYQYYHVVVINLVGKRHDNLLAENRRRAGRVPGSVLAALLAVEPHRIRGKVPAGLRGHDIEEAHHRRGYATVATAVGVGQPRGEAVWGHRTRRSGACGSEGWNAARDG